MDDSVTVARVDLQRVYDGLMGSMDMGSGCLSTAELVSLTRVGMALGADLPTCVHMYGCDLVAGHAGKHRQVERAVTPVVVELSEVDDE